jgi:hypothetical protein
MRTRHTATKMQLYPHPPAYITLPTSGSWAENPWVELFPSTQNEIYMAGISFDIPLAGGRPAEIEFGVGAPGDEETIHTYRIEFCSGVNTYTQTLLFEVPLGNIPTGSRLSMRSTAWNMNGSVKLCVMYYENLISQHKSVGRAKCFPYRADSIAVEWADFEWTYTPWYEITPGEDVEITFTSIYFQGTAFAGCPAELQLAFGAVGYEHSHIMTTKRYFLMAHPDATSRIVLPGGYPIPAGTRVVFRVQRGMSNAEIRYTHFSFNYIRNTVFLA